MNTIRLPETVVDALGKQASRDFAVWLESRFPILQAEAQVQISAFVARQKVNVLMLEQVSNLLLADAPSLKQAADGSWQWHVPVDLTLTDRGRVGRVGEVVVDARYGTVQYDEALLVEIAEASQQRVDQILAPSP